MKLTDKQKLSILKSLKLNEDFFDDFSDNEPNDDSVDDLIDEPDYTYHIHFIIYMYPFIKDVYRNGECIYYFEDPKYKPIVESGLLSMKKSLDYIFQASPIVTDYSEPIFCSSNEKIIKTFSFMNNNQSNEFEIKFSDNHFITLKTSINLSRRKNALNLIKLFHLLCRLQQIYDKLLTTKLPIINMKSTPYINVRVYRNNPYKKTGLYALMPTDLKLINFLNSKDETE